MPMGSLQPLATLYLLGMLVASVLAVIGDLKCTSDNINDKDTGPPPISTDTVDVTNGLGTYYVLDRVYLNTTLFLNGYYPTSGSTYRNMALKGSVLLSRLWFKPPFLSDFINGIFAKVKNTKVIKDRVMYSEFPAITIGSTFVNTSYSVVVQPRTINSTQDGDNKLQGLLEVSVCQYNMCEYPQTICHPNLGNHRKELWHLDTGVVSCLYKRNFTYDVNADYLYFHFYQEGGTFYAYFTDTGVVTKFLFNVYLGMALSHYYVMPLTCNSKLTLEYWVTPLTSRQYLLAFNQDGIIFNAVDCMSDFMSEIKCKTQSIAPPTGVYELNGYTVQPIADVYRRKPNLPNCNIEAWLNDKSVPSPLNWERKTFSNCNFNMSSLMSFIQADSFTCNNIDAAKIYGMCFSSITIDKFAIPNGRKVDLQLGNLGYLQSFNYRIDTTATSCQLYYNLPAANVSVSRFNPSTWNKRFGFIEDSVFKPRPAGVLTNHDVVYAQHCFKAPKNFCPCKLNGSCVGSGPGKNNGIGTCPAGTNYLTCDNLCTPDPITFTGTYKCPQTKSLVGIGEHCSGLAVKSDYCGGNSCTCRPQAFLGWSADSCLQGDKCNIFANFILHDVNSGLTCSTDLQKANTDIILGVCVNYDLYGILGQGIFVEVNATYYNSWQNLLYDSNGNLYGFRDYITNRTFMIRSCYSGRVSAAFHANSSEPALLFRNIKCNYVFNNSLTRQLQPINYFDSYLGCVVNAYNSTAISVQTCDLTVGSGYCVDYSKNGGSGGAITTGYRFTNFEPFTVNSVNDSLEPVGGLYEIQIPSEFTIGNMVEFIQTSSPKVTIDCAAFVCGDYAACKSQLVEYGSFCDNINAILTEVNELLDTTQLQVANSLMNGVTLSTKLKDGVNFNVDDINFSPVLGCLGSECSKASSRSAIEDLLFDKVKLSDVGFVEAYNNCTGGAEIRDLICVQSYKGIKVLPPLLSENQFSGYTLAATSASLFPPWTAAAGVPFYLNVQYRINGLGVTMDVLSQNQKLIANAFNNALYAIQEGFDATNSALVKIQAVVNANAEALNNLLQQLSNRFGAISASLQEILSRLDALEAEAQIDRLINGRLTALNAYVSQQLSDSTLVKFSAAQAMEKVNECVKSQSSRINFCGNGNHIISLVQNAPYGLYFIHFSYVPTKYVTARVSPGLCIAGDRGIAPKSGYFVNVNNTWMYTGSGYYYPEPITENNVVVMSTCAVNYTKAPYVMLNTSIPNLPDFKEELDQWFKNQTSVAPDLSLDYINVTFLDLLIKRMKQIEDKIEEIESKQKKIENEIARIKKIKLVPRGSLEWSHPQFEK
uniref:Spike surface glycoprotein n=1 Tax=Human coronavirus OC43 TaxID=31631 RepID=UPI00110D250A|nr:Chain A, Spike surface glycoprotein [Human coronavirus OC43]6NZK_B Chain B, Spike surface glycoprotein [Human coronavirus OC43]6NZK_C Chain C, Spike surface glycoprotein [Human coronavirus OC43]6OHW_A Chain A, Spike surface glycoprotein [Human coronavirus OC43]6OHW_B Chain B, Spike surface glycoprotein [Human coronavirus OC43]6OHW_C Chain C, Spike surface glycoprotein [Human coronavirus OC43]7PNQ_A Chain A, Spike glycoprotein [Human coronavirus OC43]7PNQ_B Chain B, Spike glycoprotein [Hum